MTYPAMQSPMHERLQPLATMAGADYFLPLVNPPLPAVSRETRKRRRALAPSPCLLTRFAVLQTLRHPATLR